jgi:transposase-like protein
MFGRETRMLLRHYLEQGTSKSAVARQLGVHRDTIHRWIRDGDLDRDLEVDAVRYGPRPPMATKLDAYKPIIEARLATYPELSAVRLLAEIRAAGYDGGYTQLKAFVRRVRPGSPARAVAGARGQCPRARHDARAAADSLRPRGALSAAAPCRTRRWSSSARPCHQATVRSRDLVRWWPSRSVH